MPFEEGQSGNPGGRPMGSRSKLTENFLKKMNADFLKHGTKAIEAARKKDPSGYIKTVASILPKNVKMDFEEGAHFKITVESKKK